MTITNTLANKFGVKEVEHYITLDDVQYFTAIDTNFDDEIEIKVRHNEVYTRIAIEGVDIDVEIDGASDFYAHRGTIEADKLTGMLEEVESFLSPCSDQVINEENKEVEKMTNTNVMTTAWDIARKGAKNFGGKVKEYFAAALKLAWKIFKGEVKEVEKYNDLKFHVRAANHKFNTDEMFYSVKELMKFIGFSKKEFEHEMQYIDPSRAESWECEVNGIICNVYVMKKYIYEM